MDITDLVQIYFNKFINNLLCWQIHADKVASRAFQEIIMISEGFSMTGSCVCMHDLRLLDQDAPSFDIVCHYALFIIM